MSLLVDESLAQLEQTLLDTLTIALKVRKLTVADAAALRAVRSVGAGGSTGFTLDDLAYVTAAANVYRWAPSSADVDDGDLVVTPNDAGPSGRWLKAVSGVQIDA